MRVAIPPIRVRLTVLGTVQGVGFRPFVAGLAARCGVVGTVLNTSSGVIIEVEGTPAQVAHFTEMLRTDAPPLAQINAVESEHAAPRGERTFEILESRSTHAGIGHVPADAALCADCLRELFDPSDRRYRYPFINCTNCGPRFTLIESLPYDRPHTTMANFPLCAACEREYHNPNDRRFHAQPVACPDCGPQVWFEQDGQRLAEREDALAAAVTLLRQGGVLAVKGIGGFHLACDAENPAAVATLRARKNRPDKPLAVMARDLVCAERIAEISAEVATRLNQPDHPILLLSRRPNSPLADGIAPGLNTVGVMLPYSPLHHLLLETLTLLVMTSGNPSGTPIVIDNHEAQRVLRGMADGFLMHDRQILQPCDDSVVRWNATSPSLIRRARGMAPQAIPLPAEVVPTLAIGGDLKNAFCLAAGREAFLSQHIGDLDTLETEHTLERVLAHFTLLTGIVPEQVVCDLHPGYRGTHWAERYARQRGLPLIRVQHHQAHAAALMAEHAVKADDPTIIFTFDGTGYGLDNTIWGGEVFVSHRSGFERVAHLMSQPLPSGDAAIRFPSRMALAWMARAGIAWDDDLAPVTTTSPAARKVLRQQVDGTFKVVETSSIGRLFDVVAALCGIRQQISYEGQAAAELEAAADVSAAGSYTFGFHPAADGHICQVDPASVLRQVINDLRAGVSVGTISMRFHRAVAEMIAADAGALRARFGIARVGLTGGVFQNALLLTLSLEILASLGFTVLTHQRIPANDGGLAYGQVWLAQLLNHAQSDQD